MKDEEDDIEVDEPSPLSPEQEQGTVIKLAETLPSPQSERAFLSQRVLDFEYKGRGYIFLFLFFLPCLWSFFIAVGWSKDDKIEDEVYNIWTRQRSGFAKDLQYAEEQDRSTLGSTAFAAMAISRDGQNLVTPERLEEIRQRMEAAESVTIQYKGETFTWQDICASNDVGFNTTYKFPCARLSPMDFFQEARWFMDEVDRVTWYQQIVRKQVIAPRLPRFGILQKFCSNLQTSGTGRSECNGVIIRRLQQGQPTQLLADVGNLEMNDPCKICIEETFENVMSEFHERIAMMFNGLLLFATQSGQNALASEYQAILDTLDRQAVIDFFSYYVARGVYIDLGAPRYMIAKDTFERGMNPGCEASDNCPAPTTLEEAKEALADHADHDFSSTVTSGNPLPVWGDNGEGPLLQGNSPVSGSGLDLSGNLFSALMFLQDANADQWDDIVETDPVYIWFMAAETPMTAHCGNGDLRGTDGRGNAVDGMTGSLMKDSTEYWCTKYNTPFEEDETLTAQYFARMWYDLLIDSPGFLDLRQGESDPYVWTIGQGCGYVLAGERHSYVHSDSQEDLMRNVSGVLYYIDEGESLGAVDRNLLMGGRTPAEYSLENPLQSVTVLQNVYPALLPENIVGRVMNCNRPGGPLDITLDDAKEVLFQFKEKFEDEWTRGWDNDGTGNVSFVGFFDDTGAVGTTGRMLKEITLSNGNLVAISMGIIGVFSVIFVFSLDPVESRVGITIVGVLLVIFAYFAAVGFGLIVGIKINVTIAWTLPFIMLGLGVDDMYMVVLALRKQKGYTAEDFLAAMKEVAIPITMTSLVNAGMFALLNINDVPAVYLSAQVALISVIFLYVTIMFCFTAWAYLDLRRQRDNRHDVFYCFKGRMELREQNKMWASVFYDKIYHPLVFPSTKSILISTHLLIWLIAGTLLGCGIWGLTDGQRKIGLGLEDFFPQNNQANRWATMRTDELASWSIQMSWGRVDYSEPVNQMKVIKQFEDVVASPHVAEVDTKQLWLADFLVWTTKHCNENFNREDPDVLACGVDQVYPIENSTCSGIWVPNFLGLRVKVIADLDTCVAFEGGICRPTSAMHPLDLLGVDESLSDSWCPVVDGWSDKKLSLCLGKWRELTGNNGRLVLKNETGTPAECEGEYHDDEVVQLPITFAAGPTMFAFDLFTHETTLEMLEETRAICDDSTEIHCWLSGIPFLYWSQYIGIYNTFWEIGGIAVTASFGVSSVFLVGKLTMDGGYSTAKIIQGSLIGAFLIAITTILCLVTVSGLSSLFEVAFTGFSLMSFVLSVGFAVEYSVHIVARWLMAASSLKTSMERVEHAMEFLFLPTFMSFASSTIGVACLAFTEFKFNEVFFFRPLMVVMLVTYFFGCFWLPVCLALIDVDCVKFGGGSEPQADESRDPAAAPVKNNELGKEAESEEVSSAEAQQVGDPSGNHEAEVHRE